MPDILRGADAITDRRERVAFVATLYESGELEHYGKALVLGLRTSWRLSKHTVEGYAREAEVAASLAKSPAERARLAAGVVGRFRKAEALALTDKVPARAARAAVAAILGEAKVLGLVPSAEPAPAPPAAGASGPGPGYREVETVRCPACGEDQLAGKKLCGDCGAPLAPAPQGDPSDRATPSG